MSVSVAAVMRHCRNYFEDWYLDGTFRITGNSLTPVQRARWLLIRGSECHDGVWEVTDGYLTGRDVTGLWDEEFTGRVWGLNPPPEFLALCAQIDAYDAKNPVGAYMQERFGDYSYTRGQGNQPMQGWAAAFAPLLSRWTKMAAEV